MTKQQMTSGSVTDLCSQGTDLFLANLFTNMLILHPLKPFTTTIKKNSQQPSSLRSAGLSVISVSLYVFVFYMSCVLLGIIDVS